MPCQYCKQRIVNDMTAFIWMKTIGKRSVTRLFCSRTCRQKWIDEAPLRVLRALAEFEAILN